ncbi:MAG: WecB/TagA/CpsF family glycosyltransferase [Pirellulales bacterium]
MPPTVSLFGMKIDAVDMSAAVARVQSWIDNHDGRCQYVVTPNTDHAVMFQENPALREVYATAGMVLADGFPIVAAARLLGKPLPERVTGSDLVPSLFSAYNARGGEHDSQAPAQRLRVFLLGAADGVAERAAANIEHRWPGVEVVGCYSPPLGFEKDDAENAKIIQQINASAPQLLVIGLGAPKQELWISRFQHELNVPAALCVGATIDFLAGEKRRAPRWMQRAGLEWLHRCASEPRRLVKRYARDAWIFPGLLWQEARGKFPRRPRYDYEGPGVRKT